MLCIGPTAHQVPTKCNVKRAPAQLEKGVVLSDVDIRKIAGYVEDDRRGELRGCGSASSKLAITTSTLLLIARHAMSFCKYEDHRVVSRYWNHQAAREHVKGLAVVVQRAHKTLPLCIGTSAKSGRRQASAQVAGEARHC